MLFPKAAVARAVDAALPEDMGATGETVEAINKCCAEFVSLIASEAKDVGEHSHIRKDHVVEAIKRLGLESYLEGVEADVEEAAKIAREKKERRRPKRTKEEEEAAAKEQRELLQASEKRFHSGQMFF